MPQSAYGFEEVIGMGIETTYDTEVVAAYWFRPISFNLVESDPALAGLASSGYAVEFLRGATGDTPREYKAAPVLSGTIEFEVETDDIGWFLINALMSDASPDDYTNQGVSDTVAYVHDFFLARTLGSEGPPQSLTITRFTGQKNYEFAGCMINTLEFQGNPGEPIRCVLDIIGARETGDDPANPGTSYSAEKVLQFHNSQIRYAADNVINDTLASGDDIDDVHNWSFKVENNLRQIATAGGTANRKIGQPIFNDYRKMSCTFTRDWNSDTFYDAFKLEAENTASFGTFEVIITGDTLLVGATTTFPTLRLYMNAGKVVGGPTTYGGGGGPIAEEITIDAAASDTGVGQVSITNITSGDYVS